MRKRLPILIVLACVACSLVPKTFDAAAYTGAFLSAPHQAAPQSFSGNNLVIANRSYVGFNTKVCLTVSNAVNVYVHDVDFDSCGGGIFLINVSGNVRIENVRGRNIGDGSIGSGHSNLIQLNNTWQDALNDNVNGIRHIKEYGGDTEDVISVYKSGGRDATHPLIIGDVHIEHPLPPDALAWSSGSGTCVNLADAGGHDIELRNSTFLNCAAVGIQMNQPNRVWAHNNVLYGAARATSNVGLSQYGTCTCAGNRYTYNRVWWVKSTGSASPMWLQHSEYFTDSTTGNVKQDTTIDPANLKVRL